MRSRKQLKYVRELGKEMKGEERMKAREDHERRAEDGAKEGHERR